MPCFTCSLLFQVCINSCKIITYYSLQRRAGRAAMEARGRCRRGGGSKVTANPEDICPATWKRYIMCVYCVYHLPIFLLKSNLRSVFWGISILAPVFFGCFCWITLFSLLVRKVPLLWGKGKAPPMPIPPPLDRPEAFGMEVWIVDGDGDGDFLRRSCKDTVWNLRLDIIYTLYCNYYILYILFFL